MDWPIIFILTLFTPAFAWVGYNLIQSLRPAPATSAPPPPPAAPKPTLPAPPPPRYLTNNTPCLLSDQAIGQLSPAQRPQAHAELTILTHAHLRLDGWCNVRGLYAHFNGRYSEHFIRATVKKYEYQPAHHAPLIIPTGQLAKPHQQTPCVVVQMGKRGGQARRLVPLASHQQQESVATTAALSTPPPQTTTN